jgi:hypothetical protein
VLGKRNITLDETALRALESALTMSYYGVTPPAFIIAGKIERSEEAK